MTRLQVTAGRSTLVGHARQAKAIDTVTELVWNGIDAEATKVAVRVEGRGDVPDMLTVRDDGHGMTEERAREVFKPWGDSWKRERGRSENGKRPVRGRRGRGRFTVYAIAESATWASYSATAGSLGGVRVHGRESDIDHFDFGALEDGPDVRRGTKVTLRLTQSQKAARLLDADFRRELTARLAPVLLESRDVTVTFNGTDLDPIPIIQRDEFLDVSWPSQVMDDPPTLRVIEWETEVPGHELLLLDESGTTLARLAMKNLAPGLSWSAYLRGPMFSDEVSEGDLQVPEFRWHDLIDAARAALGVYLGKRLDEEVGRLVERWKEDGTYPYSREPQNAVEDAEQGTFNVVAVLARRALPKDPVQRKMSLVLMKEALQQQPDNVPELIGQVMELPQSQKDELTALLRRTPLAHLISATRTVTDRLEFVAGLRGLLFGDEHRNAFLERGQLHPLIADNCWIFGEEWTYAEEELSIGNVLRKHVGILRPEEAANADTSRRIDLLLNSVIPEHNHESDLRRLIVELKRANKRLGLDEVNQIKLYARTVVSQPQCCDERSSWDFWLIGSDIHRDAESERNQFGRPFGCIDAPTDGRYRVWMLTWSDLLDRASRRLEFFRERLSYSPVAEDAIQAMAEKYPDLMPRTVRQGQ